MSRRRRPLGVLALALALASGACAPEPPCGLRLCDIREPACQDEVASATACLRGLPTAEVPIRVLSQERYLAESIAAGEGNVDLPLFTRWMAGLALLRLAAPDVSVAEASQEGAAWVAAFYDPGTRSITIIDRGRPLDARGAITLLVHEYTHALQDRTVGLDRFRARLPNDLDRVLASKAVTEGEASLVEDLAALGLFGEAERAIDWPQVFGTWQGRAREAAVETRLPVDQSFGHFPYPFGMPYVHGAYRSGGFAAVDRLYDEPPASVAQVLAGFGTAEPSGGAWAEELGADAVPVLPERFALVDSDRLGAWLLEVFVDRVLASAPPGLDRDRARADLAGLGRGLRADRLSIWRDLQTDRTVACWRLRLASAEQADRLAHHLDGAGPWVASSRERDVVLVASADPEVLALAGPDLTFGPLPPAGVALAGAALPALARGCPGRTFGH